MKDYGVRVYRQGVEFRTDGRWRDPKGLAIELAPRVSRYRKRGVIKAWSESSSRSLAFLCANTTAVFRSILTLTYRAPVEAWETDAERNGRIALQCKEDLNRFLSCMRRELGGYVWVQEFQARGVVHFHVLCEREVGQERVQLVWCRAIDALGDADALRYGAKAEIIRTENGARSYLGRYVGKQRQKLLPPGIEGAGRWWGSSQSLKLDLRAELIVAERGENEHHPVALYVMRSLRRYLTKQFGRKFRGGTFVNWGGELAGKMAEMIPVLKQGYLRQSEAQLKGKMPLLEKRGWDAVEGVEWPCDGNEVDGSCSCAPESSKTDYENGWREFRKELIRRMIPRHFWTKAKYRRKK